MTFWKKKEGEGDNLEAIEDPKPVTQPEAQAAPAENESPPPTSNVGKVRSALSAGTVIQGKLSFDTPVRIDGKLSGEVYSSKTLIIGETAQINATLDAAVLVIMGKVKGDIKATEKVQVCSGANVEGAICAPSIIIESGACFNGTCEMRSKAALSGKTAQNTAIFSEDILDIDRALSNTAGSNTTGSSTTGSNTTGSKSGAAKKQQEGEEPAPLSN